MPVRRTGGAIGVRLVPTTTTASGIWRLAEVAAARRTNTWPSVRDPFWSNVSLLLKFDGSNGSTTITDSSNNGITATASGTAAISTAQAKFGQSVAVGGAGNFITVPQSDRFAFGTGAFTVEGWVYITNRNSNSMRILATRSPVNFTFEVSNTGRLQAWDGANVLTWGANDDVPLNQWVHIAFARSGTVFRAFVNGVQRGTVTNSRNYTITNNIQFPTTLNDNSSIGFIDEIRVTKGVARYTESFTPPDREFLPPSGEPYWANVSLLLKFDGSNGSSTFADSSSNALSVTAVGNAQISTEQFKFGQSGLFDGTGDYLSIADNSAFDVGSGDFTLEAWVRPTTSTTNLRTLYAKRTDGIGHMALAINDGAFAFWAASGTAAWDVINGVTFGSAALNTWHHVAVVRRGSAFTGYLNGVGTSLGTSSAAIGSGSTAAVTIGGESSGNAFIGNIDEYRLTKGVARYTANFTPPDVEFSTPSGDPYWSKVSLLLHMDGSNGSTTFTDTSPAQKTVTRFGNAAISTAQSRIGGASALFSATTDYLQVPASAAFAPGTGDFTVEGWFYQTQEPPAYGSMLWSQTISGTNYFVIAAGLSQFPSTVTPRQLSFVSTLSGGGTWFAHPTIYSLNTWNHFAVTRASGTLRLFLNGVASSGLTGTPNLTNTTYTPTIGRYTHANAQQFIGYLDEIRYTLGVARYTTNFTPSTTPFSDSL